jgi:hypothetical protein
MPAPMAIRAMRIRTYNMATRFERAAVDSSAMVNASTRASAPRATVAVCNPVVRIPSGAAKPIKDC